MTPQRLASILREADAGDAIRYLELAETIEERDLHYVGVLGTRRRAVAQLDISVEAGSDDAEDEAIAEEVRDWLKRDELAEELFHILDCIGKGFSTTEILWDHSEGQWTPERLELRDPRWFEFNQIDLTTPMLRNARPGGAAARWQVHLRAHRSKSGLPLRSGVAGVAAWAWMFKAFTQRDWTIFTQTYGQPIRLGKYHPGATGAAQATLMRAVSNIAGDMAAIVPQSMMLELISPPNISAAQALYKERADWLDQQVSKAILATTATTDAVTGGLGSGKEHRQVQEDMGQKDSTRPCQAILNRDLIRPWVLLNHGPRKAFPKLKIARAEQEDLAAFSSAIAPMIDRGLEVPQEAVRAKFNLPEPKPGRPPDVPIRAQSGTVRPGGGACDRPLGPGSRD